MSAKSEAKSVGLRSLPRRQIIMTMAGVMLALFLSSLDQTIVTTAMPRIVADLGGFEHYTWLTTAYMIAATVVLPITGRLTDIYGRKPFYIGGIVIFIMGSAFAGLSQSMIQIIISRGIQGIGAGVMMANAFIVIGDLFPPAERGKYQGMISGVFGISSVIGPPLGGFLTDALSWHWVFYINIPLGIATVVLFSIFFPHFRPDNGKSNVDFAGVTALVVTLIPLLLGLSWGGVEYPWNSIQIISLFALSIAALIVFLAIEKKSKAPIIPLWIFKNQIVSLSLITTFLSGIAMFGGIVFLPLFFQGVLGLTATATGSYLTPMMLGMVFGSAVSGVALTRTGGHYKIQGAIGLAFIALGLILLTTMNIGTSPVRAVAYIVLVGLGLGVSMPIYTIAVQNTVSYEVLGVATSTVPFFRSLGGSFGLAILGSVMTNRFASEFANRLPEEIKKILPQELLSSVTHSAQTLLNQQIQARLHTFFDQTGQQGANLYEQAFRLLRESLNTALAEVFFICFIVTVLAFVSNLFIKEIPLHKQHRITEPQPGPDKPLD